MTRLDSDFPGRKRLPTRFLPEYDRCPNGLSIVEQASSVQRAAETAAPHFKSRRSVHTRSCSAYVYGRMICCRVLCQWLRYRRSLTSFETTVSGCQRLHEPADTIQRHVLLIAFLQYEFCKCYLSVHQFLFICVV